MFADEAFRDELRLSAVNSINWARVMAQVVVLRVGRAPQLGRCGVLRARPATSATCSPAGWPRRMGLPVDAAHRAPATATTSSPGGSRRACSRCRRRRPHAQPEHGHPGVVQPRAPAVRAPRPRRRRRSPTLMQQLPHRRAGPTRPATRSFPAAASTTTARAAEIGAGARRDGRARRPAHRGRLVRRRPHAARPLDPMVCLATAHPAKFPDAVEAATGIRPAAARPAGRPARAPRALRRAPQRPRRHPPLPPPHRRTRDVRATNSSSWRRSHGGSWETDDREVRGVRPRRVRRRADRRARRAHAAGGGVDADTGRAGRSR